MVSVHGMEELHYLFGDAKKKKHTRKYNHSLVAIGSMARASLCPSYIVHDIWGVILAVIQNDSVQMC